MSANLDLVRSIGADRAIDYAREDFTKNGGTYDVIFDAVGKHSFKRCKDSLNTGGRYLATDGFTNVILGIWTKRFGDKKVIFEIPPRYTKQDIIFLKKLIGVPVTCGGSSGNNSLMRHSGERAVKGELGCAMDRHSRLSC